MQISVLVCVFAIAVIALVFATDAGSPFEFRAPPPIYVPGPANGPATTSNSTTDSNSVSSTTSQTSREFDWSYQGCLGRDRWKTRYPACNGCRQSPINVDTVSAVKVKNQPFVLANFNSTGVTTTLVNDGNLVNIQVAGKNLPSISRGGLPGTYLLDHISIHWGSDSGFGGEHTINGKRFAMEIQYLFYKKNYNNYKQALLRTDGIAGFAVPVQAVDDDNAIFNALIGGLDNVESPNDTSPITLPNLATFLPSTANIDKYFQYHGSVTTPGCHEACSWTIFSTALNISEIQLDSFRSLTNHDNEDMVDNYRFVQDLGLRKVQINTSGGTTAKKITAAQKSTKNKSTKAG